MNDKIDEVLEDIRKTVEVDNEEIEEIPEEDEVEQEEEEEEVDQPLFIPAMSAGPELENAPTQQQSGSIPIENPVTSIPSSQPVTQPFVQSTPSFQELTPEFQEKKIKSLEDRFKCHLQEKINILKVKPLSKTRDARTRTDWYRTRTETISDRTGTIKISRISYLWVLGSGSPWIPVKN